jgi:anti-sigma-K factor RskA
MHEFTAGNTCSPRPMPRSRQPRWRGPQRQTVTRTGNGREEMTDTPDVAALTRAISRWRLLTALASTIAVAAVVVAIGDRMIPAVSSHQYLAVLSSTNTTPAFVATVNLDSNSLVVRRLAAAPSSDQSYQLWAIPAGQAPQSLGVLTSAEYSHDLGDLEPNDLPLAVSLEPKGGSPNAGPSGPVVFTGTLIAGN